MELSRKVCVAEGMERSMSLLCAAIHGMRGKSVCRGGLSDKMPLPVVRYRVIRAKVCVALRNVQFPRMSFPRYTEWSRKVCVAEVWSVACSLSVLRYTELSRKVCVAVEDASFRCRIPFAIQRFVLESVCRRWFGWI